MPGILLPLNKFSYSLVDSLIHSALMSNSKRLLISNAPWPWHGRMNVVRRLLQRHKVVHLVHHQQRRWSLQLLRPLRPRLHPPQRLLQYRRASFVALLPQRWLNASAKVCVIIVMNHTSMVTNANGSFSWKYLILRNQTSKFIQVTPHQMSGHHSFLSMPSQALVLLIACK